MDIVLACTTEVVHILALSFAIVHLGHGARHVALHDNLSCCGLVLTIAKLFFLNMKINVPSLSNVLNPLPE